MTEREFLQAICQHPSDDNCRLIFADWLDEHGNADRAEFIRLQIEHARDPFGETGNPKRMLRERELFLRHRDAWLAELPSLAGVTWGDSFPHPHAGLRVLRLGDNRLGIAGALALAKSVSLSHLHTLELGETGLGPAAIQTLAACPLSKRLRDLSVYGNPIGSEGLKCFLDRDVWPNLVRLHLSFRPNERALADDLKKIWGNRVDMVYRDRFLNPRDNENLLL